MVQHSESINRSVQVVNLDPAAEHFNYPVMAGEYSMLVVHVHIDQVWLQRFKWQPNQEQKGFKKTYREKIYMKKNKTCMLLHAYIGLRWSKFNTLQLWDVCCS